MQILFAMTLLLSATLLFIVEPMFAKMVLRYLGGSPSVWNTCLVFYQAALLAGYLYAHWSVKWLGARKQAGVHLALLLLPWLVLPIGIASTWTPPPESNPIPSLLLLLTVVVGLPFFCISATAPLAQAWFADTGHRSAKDPYWLYAASNVGSMLGLAAYPLVIESHLTLAQQSRWWAIGYGALMVLIVGCAVALWCSRKNAAAAEPKGTGPCFRSTVSGESNAIEPKNGPVPADEALPVKPDAVVLDEAAPSWSRRLWWLALALVPSSLLLGVTTYISVDVAAVPLLWAIPLGLYLLSFVIVFSRWRFPSHRWAVWMQSLFLVVMAAVYYLGSGIHTSQVIMMAVLHLTAFFVTALVCHGELANDRPAAAHLTEFYLWMSLGGVVGGLLNALVAPLIFRTVLEYPLMMVAACLLRPVPARSTFEWLFRRLDMALMLLLGAIFAFAAWAVPARRFLTLAHKIDWPWLTATAQTVLSKNGKIGLIVAAAAVAFLLQRRPFRFATAFVTVLIVGAICEEDEGVMFRARSFFGVLRVEYAVDDDAHLEHSLLHGSTLHGRQCLEPDQRYEPWTYYTHSGPVGDIMRELRARPTFREKGRIGVVGLGTGTVAAYGLPGQHLTYFEIDPAVKRIATDPRFFTYVTDCSDRGCDLQIRMGDARLTLADEPKQAFDVLFIDAFSSDAIPLHLITREAIALYLDKLSDHGILLIHISNRHLDLEPVLGNVAGELGIVSRTRNDDDESDDDTVPLRGKCESTWVALVREAKDLGDLDDPTKDWKPTTTNAHLRVWTDDFSNIIGVVNWNLDWSWLPGHEWWRNLWQKKEKKAEEGGK